MNVVILQTVVMATNITYDSNNVDEKFREILRNNDPRNFFSTNEPHSVVQNVESLFIIDGVSDQNLSREMLNKAFGILSSIITTFNITNNNRFLYSEILNTLLDIKKKTQIDIHKQIIEISLLCVTLKIILGLENNEQNKELTKDISQKIFNEYTDYIEHFTN